MSEKHRQRRINGVMFYNDKGTLAFESKGGNLTRYYPSSKDAYGRYRRPNEELASLFLNMALSLATPPDWTRSTGDSGDMLMEDYGGEEPKADLSDWVDRTERAAVLVNAAAACLQMSWHDDSVPYKPDARTVDTP